MEALGRDVRFAFRMLAKAPGLTFVAVTVLALGIGANVAIFSMMRGVLLRPLPFSEPARLVRVEMNNPTLPNHHRAFSPQDLDDFRAQQNALSGVGGYWFSAASSGKTLTGADEPLHLQTAFADSQFFSVLGVAPALGRTFTKTEDVHGNDGVVILSDHLWRSRFDAQPGVVGKTVNLDGKPVIVIGVMSPRFAYPDPVVDVWMPLAQMTDDQIPHLRQLRWIDAVGRLKPGVSVAQAANAASVVTKRLEAQYRQTNEGLTSIALTDLRESISGDARPLLLALFAAVVLVLLMVCANLASLLLARDESRRREFAIRASLGADRAVLRRQSITESMVLAVIAGVLSFVIARVLATALLQMSRESIPRAAEIQVDGVVVAFGALLTMLTGTAIGALPALRHRSRVIWETLKSSGFGTSEAGERKRGRGGLIVGEIALACVLLTLTSLVLRSFWKLVNTDPGFRTDHVLAVQIPVPLYKFSNPRTEVAAYRQELMRGVAAVPGVVAVGASKTLPLQGGGEPYGFTVQSRGAARDLTPTAGTYIVTQGYFEALSIPVKAGRTFTEADLVQNRKVAIVNESLAREYWHGEDALGKTLSADTLKLEVIGVVGDVRNEGLAKESGTAIYMPASLATRQQLDLFVRTSGDPLMLASSVRQAIHQFAPDQAITDISPLTSVVAQDLAKPRFFSTVLTAFGSVALLLAGLGIFGVISYNVRERTKEIGVRMALGAAQPAVMGMVLRQALGLVAAGTAIGLAGALLLARFLGSMLYGVGSTDPLAFGAALALLGTVSLVAAYIPARRATRVDPIVALRYE